MLYSDVVMVLWLSPRYQQRIQKASLDCCLHLMTKREILPAVPSTLLFDRECHGVQVVIQ